MIYPILFLGISKAHGSAARADPLSSHHANPTPRSPPTAIPRRVRPSRHSRHGRSLSADSAGECV